MDERLHTNILEGNEMKLKATEIIKTMHEAYDFFNEELFDGKLPDCVLTLSRELKRANGFYAHESFTDGKEKASEISLNPDQLSRGEKLAFSTLVHEQVHCWQFNFGNDIPKSVYHNKEFAKKMMKIGLVPSSTGAKGGNKTGRNVSHYIDEDGPFDEAYTKWKRRKKKSISWHSRIFNEPDEEETKKRKRPRRKRLICPGCELKVSVPEHAELECLTCNEEMSINE